MSIFFTVMISFTTLFIGYVVGKFKGVSDYHELLMREGKIHEK